MVEQKQDQGITLKIIDLGLAKPDPENQNNNLNGYVSTRPYRAPEAVLGIDRDQEHSIMTYDKKGWF
jgi:serine/threonine protein kinase